MGLRTDTGQRPTGPTAATWRRFLPTGLPTGLAAWTLFVWGGRIRNVAADLAAGIAVGWFPIVASAVFVILGIAVLVGEAVGWISARSGRPRSVGSWWRSSLVALAGTSVVVWVVRGIDIALGDHTVGFIAVHTVLAVVSIGLGLAVLVWHRSA